MPAAARTECAPYQPRLTSYPPGILTFELCARPGIMGKARMAKFLFKLWKLNRPYKGRFFLGVLFGILNGLGQPLVIGTAAFVFCVMFTSNHPDDLKRLADAVPHWVPGWLREMFMHMKQWVTDQTAGSLGGKILIVSMIPLVVLLRGLVAYLSNYLMAWVAVRTICDLRVRLFEHLLNLPLSFFTKSSTGELMSRNSDLLVLQNMIAVSMVTLISCPVTILAYVNGMLVVDPMLTIVALLVLSLCVIPITVYSRKGRRASAAIQTEQAALGRVLHESFTGNRIIKAYNLEDVVVKQFKATLNTFRSNFMRVVRATESPGPLIEFVGSIGLAGMFLYLARRGSSPVDFLTFVTALLLMYAPIKNLTRLHSQLTQAQAATQRVFELLATANTLTDPAHPVPLRAAGAEIHFDNVSFSYGNEMVLRDIQLKIQPGQMAALVGMDRHRENHPDQSPPAFLRPHLRRHPHWRSGFAGCRLARPSFPDRRRHPGGHPVQRHHSQQHRLRTPRRQRRRSGGSGQARLRARIHHGQAGRL